MSELDYLLNKVRHGIKRIADVQKLFIDEFDVLVEDITKLSNYKKGGKNESSSDT